MAQEKTATRINADFFINSRNPCSVFCFILFIAVLAIDTVHANNDADTTIMTMTFTKFGNIKFSLRGSGSLILDWGDGTVENRTLTPGVVTFSHHYTKKARRTIIIYGRNITHLTCYGCKLTSLDVSNNPGLKYLRCARNRLTNLDVSKNVALTYLFCDKNQLITLDVSNNTMLTDLHCCKNQLTDLDVSNNTALTILHCSGNQVNYLDVSRNSLLINLICDGNQLTALDASNTDALMFLNCRKNRLTADALNVLFGALNATEEEGKLLYIRNNPGTDASNKNIATDKNWNVDTTFR